MEYQLTHFDVVKRISDNAFIPYDENNIDYKKYLNWLKDGNTPLPADPILSSETLTPEQKLKNAGLTVEELKSLLGI